MTQEIYDLLVIGGGINGCGIAADAAGRGLSVLLCEKNDLSSATSQSSSKLIHGGLRYLEQYEFKLVRESLVERERLLKNAPHLVGPLRFIMPHNKNLRPAWLIRIGLFLYDFLDWDRSLPASTAYPLKEDDPSNPLLPYSKRAFEYSDCRVDDARLVVCVAKQAEAHGTSIRTRTEFVGASRKNGLWHVELKNEAGQVEKLKTRAIVNAAGPWAEQVLNQGFHIPTHNALRLIKGSHIVIPKLYEGPKAYILQHTDGRVIFVIPYEKDFTLIGTTDLTYVGDPAKVEISAEETNYLIEIINSYFKQKLTPADVAWSYAGVRPLKNDHADSAQKVTRDYSLELCDENGKAPLLSIFGGKLTTYRKLSDSALLKLKPYFPQMGPSWTAKACLPGGDLPHHSLAHFEKDVAHRYPWLPSTLCHRLCKSYGQFCLQILGQAKSLHDLGEHFGGQLYAKEIDYLKAHEWAKTGEDILWRRSKLGLHLSKEECERIVAYVENKVSVRELEMQLLPQ